MNPAVRMRYKTKPTMWQTLTRSAANPQAAFKPTCVWIIPVTVQINSDKRLVGWERSRVARVQGQILIKLISPVLSRLVGCSTLIISPMSAGDLAAQVDWRPPLMWPGWEADESKHVSMAGGCPTEAAHTYACTLWLSGWLHLSGGGQLRNKRPPSAKQSSLSQTAAWEGWKVQSASMFRLYVQPPPHPPPQAHSLQIWLKYMSCFLISYLGTAKAVTKMLPRKAWATFI